MNKEASSASPRKAVSHKRKAHPGTGRAMQSQIYLGPSVDGMDVEYIEIVSGRVSDRKPSFMR
ncbi:hypothetical protein [Paenibacillus tengchongensis]|uniref:hypothetical protein n=1 Tax=Paenibacillus tengchongensis TaxID=2608684 RepID=UPI00124D800A|nr:hypothetical protein [Paenibacillus tengchongensis]